MQLHLTERLLKSYKNAPLAVQQAFKKQSRLLINNLRHPSLHAKKYDEANDIWQARVNQSWRFYFKIEGEIYLILDIIAHLK